MHSRLREQQKQPTTHLVMLQLEQRTRQNQHRKYSSQTMFSSVHFFFCCSSRVARIRLYVCFCCCCRLFFSVFRSVDGHFLASLSFLILQIYVRIAHFMFSSYYFFLCAHHRQICRSRCTKLLLELNIFR